MKVDVGDINAIPGVRRIESFPMEAMNAAAMELTHTVYPHDEVYGRYCTLEDHIACPPEEVFRYLADVRTLAEWTYSLRDFGPPDAHGVVCSRDKIVPDTLIYTRVVANREAMTVDYHCAWDQGERLWMIYLMRVVPAELVLDRPGSVVLWTNCRHPYYDANPFPEVDVSRLYVAFLAETPTAAGVERLGAFDAGREEFKVAGKQIYLHYPDGAGRARLPVERGVGVAATVRNWRTVNKLIELSTR